MNAVATLCNSCHDQENDPKFEFAKYMPKIWHSGFKAVNPPAVKAVVPAVNVNVGPPGK